MTKRNKSKEKSGTAEKSAMPTKKTLTLVLGVILLVAVIAVAAYVVFVPGTGSSTAGKSTITGTGTGAAVVNGNSVSVYYTGMFTNGTVFDSNINSTPMTFTVGSHQVIAGFENALLGMKAGQTKTVTIPVDQAYGPYKQEYIRVMNRTGNLATMELVAGKMLNYRDPATNEAGAVKILSVTPDTVTVDGNSPLAGEPLTFTIQLVSVNTAP
jgi:peptidylprolyl isomerase